MLMQCINVLWDYVFCCLRVTTNEFITVSTSHMHMPSNPLCVCIQHVPVPALEREMCVCVRERADERVCNVSIFPTIT